MRVSLLATTLNMFTFEEVIVLEDKPSIAKLHKSENLTVIK